jgi:superfamily II DNA or RNA helicase
VTDKNTILKKNGFYFDTYRLFSKSIQFYDDNKLHSSFENTIFIMDEIHNLTASLSKISSHSLTNTKAYAILYRVMHLLRNRKLLCMTGTPIRDKPYEIAKILNLVIPKENAFPIGEKFNTEYLDEVETINMLGNIQLTLYTMKEDMISDFQMKIQGYVSYLKK